MPQILHAMEFLELAKTTPVVDVRSPSEFLQGHIPGAVNIPLFDDRERAEVGTLYTQTGRNHAIIRGLDIVLPKTGKLTASIKKLHTGNSVLFYCWRGGMRSSNMAILFEKTGSQAHVLSGGYKAYRKEIRKQLDLEARIVVLGGFTGSGKTEILQSLAKQGEQVIDLEDLASHKGSAFGGIGLPDQPTNEQFESNLYDQWRKLDRSRIIWVEDESRMIGKVTLPEPVIRKIQQQPLIILEVDKEIRVQRLVQEYAGIDDELLREAVKKIEKRLGILSAREALRSIREKNYATVAENVLSYYDKAYSYSIERRAGQLRYHFPVQEFDPETIAIGLIKFVRQNIKDGTYLPGL